MTKFEVICTILVAESVFIILVIAYLYMLTK